ncbi:MAG: PorT family protein [Cyclobacteriaceae bacterium]|nr:PorT family protein [Cyclobacteriaceae bacterium]
MMNLRSTILTLALACLTTVAMAQFGGKDGKKPRKDSKKTGFIGGKKNNGAPKGARTGGGDSPQWSLGIKGGVHLSDVVSTQSYTVVTPLDLSSNLTNNKLYDQPYSNIGNHIGLTGAFSINPNITLNLEPGYATYKFGYQTSYSWDQFEDQQSFVQIDNDVDHTISYLDIPLSIKYHIKTGPLKPYIMVGGYYGFRTNADKEITTIVEDGAAGGLDEISSSTQRIGVDNLFIRSSAGVMAGAGVSLDVGNSPSNVSGSTDLGTVRFVLGANYRYGLHNVVDVQNRFEDSALTSGLYDVTDDLEVRSIEIYVGVQFTLKYKDF